MAIQDAQLLFSAAQDLTAGDGVDENSTNVWDAGSAKKAFSGYQRAYVAVTVAAAGGTTPTIRARFVGAADAALTSGVIILADSGDSRALTAADLPYQIQLHPGPTQLDTKQYYGVIYTMTGTVPTATVSAAIQETQQTNMVP
jgi:hypothetical protein